MGIKRTRKIRQVAPRSDIIILAIDPASHFGWAISETEYGVWDLRTRRDESMGMKLIRLKAKVRELHDITEFNVVAYERPAGRHTASVIHEAKLIAVIEEWCEHEGIHYRSYSATEIKKFATGKGTAGKPLMIKAAKEKLGYTGNNDNEADALWILQLAKRDLNIK